MECLRVPAVFREYIPRVLAVFRDYILRVLAVFRGSVYTADTLPTSISGFDTADTPILAVLLPLILPVLAVFRPSVLLILPASAVFRPSVLLILPVLAVRNVLDTPSILEVRSILGASLQASSPSGALHDLNGGRTRFLVAPGPRSQRVPSGDPT